MWNTRRLRLVYRGEAVPAYAGTPGTAANGVHPGEPGVVLVGRKVPNICFVIAPTAHGCAGTSAQDQAVVVHGVLRLGRAPGRVGGLRIRIVVGVGVNHCQIAADVGSHRSIVAFALSPLTTPQ